MPPLFTIYAETPDYDKRPEAWKPPEGAVYARTVVDGWWQSGYGVAVDFWFDRLGLHMHIIANVAIGTDEDGRVAARWIVVGATMPFGDMVRLLLANLGAGRGRPKDNGDGDIPPWEDL